MNEKNYHYRLVLWEGRVNLKPEFKWNGWEWEANDEAPTAKELEARRGGRRRLDDGGGARRGRGASEGEWDGPGERRRVSPGSVEGSSGWRAVGCSIRNFSQGTVCNSSEDLCNSRAQSCRRAASTASL